MIKDLADGAWAQPRLPAEVRQQLLDATYDGQPFGQYCAILGCTQNAAIGTQLQQP